MADGAQQTDFFQALEGSVSSRNSRRRSTPSVNESLWRENDPPERKELLRRTIYSLPAELLHFVIEIHKSDHSILEKVCSWYESVQNYYSSVEQCTGKPYSLAALPASRRLLSNKPKSFLFVGLYKDLEVDTHHALLLQQLNEEQLLFLKTLNHHASQSNQHFGKTHHEASVSNFFRQIREVDVVAKEQTDERHHILLLPATLRMYRRWWRREYAEHLESLINARLSTVDNSITTDIVTEVLSRAYLFMPLERRFDGQKSVGQKDLLSWRFASHIGDTVEKLFGMTIASNAAQEAMRKTLSGDIVAQELSGLIVRVADGRKHRHDIWSQYLAEGYLQEVPMIAAKVLATVQLSVLHPELLTCGNQYHGFIKKLESIFGTNPFLPFVTELGRYIIPHDIDTSDWNEEQYLEYLWQNLYHNKFRDMVRFGLFLTTIMRVLHTDNRSLLGINNADVVTSQRRITPCAENCATAVEVQGELPTIHHVCVDLFVESKDARVIEIKTQISVAGLRQRAPAVILQEHVQQVQGYVRLLQQETGANGMRASVVYIDPIRTTVLDL